MECTIIVDKFYDFQNHQVLIGGVETYIMDLAKCLKLYGWETTICQLGRFDINTTFAGVKIEQYNIKRTFWGNVYQRLFNKVSCRKRGVIICATDQLGIKSPSKNVVSIQHGIAFDIPAEFLHNGLWKYSAFLIRINKYLRCLKNISRFNNVNNIVCVDYNFFNWIRTLETISDTKNIAVIPNYSHTRISESELEEKLHSTKRKKILFARRFEDYRGVLLFSSVVDRLLEEYRFLEFTFAGNGTYLNFLRTKYSNIERVQITSYKAEESVNFHKKYDYAVIPTIFSEGTSLSLCEAMAAGCLVLASHVGGMTNMILDKHNGLFFYPNEISLYECIKSAIKMSDAEYISIVKNAYNVSRTTFSLECWGKKWNDFLVKNCL